MGFSPAPQGLDIGVYGAESLLSKRQEWQWTDRERSDRWPDAPQTKISQRFPTRLSWVQCDWTKGLEGADGPAAATETSCVPLLENQALTKFS